MKIQMKYHSKKVISQKIKLLIDGFSTVIFLCKKTCNHKKNKQKILKKLQMNLKSLACQVVCFHTAVQ